MKIDLISQFPIVGFEILLSQSQAEGFRFLARLEKDWKMGKNCFDQPGEGLFQMVIQNQVVGIGGINRDPYSTGKRVGRLRRMYIHPNWRGQGLGAKMVQHLLEFAIPYFDSIQLRTDTIAAARFYEKIGFRVVVGDPNVSHMIRLNR